MVDIDSGGGMANHASIGSSFATGNAAVGTNENKSGPACFVEMRDPTHFTTHFILSRFAH